jgi:SAM-dependent methyltransferase
MIYNKCPLCSNDRAKLQQDNFTGYQVDMKFQIFLCDNCTTSYPLPRVNADKLYDIIYKNQENVPGYSRYWYYFKEIKKQKNPLAFLANSGEAYWGIKEALSKTTKSKDNLKILEVGCGLGYLTYALRLENYDVNGIDISEEAINKAKQNFGNYFICQDLFKYVENNNEIFDVIILTEVIEHLEKPIEFLEITLKLLKNDGKIILTTPNRSISSLDIVWDTESPPIHHWWFSENSMKWIADKFKLNLDFISFEKYYNNKPKEYNTKKIIKKVFRPPIINEKWEIYSNRIPRKKGKLEMKLKPVFYKFSFLIRAYLKLKTYIYPSTIICGERGKFMCAVFQKDQINTNTGKTVSS